MMKQYGNNNDNDDLDDVAENIFPMDDEESKLGQQQQQNRNNNNNNTQKMKRSIIIRRIIFVTVLIAVLAGLVVLVLKLFVSPKNSSSTAATSSNLSNSNNKNNNTSGSNNNSSTIEKIVNNSTGTSNSKGNTGNQSIASSGTSDSNSSTTSSIQKTTAPSTGTVVSPSSSAPTPVPLTSTTKLGCLPDRFDNEEMDIVDPIINFNKLHPGQYICTQPYKTGTAANPVPQRFRFGVNSKGDVVWKDTVTNNETRIYTNPSKSTDVYFALTINGTMVLYNATTTKVLWDLEPTQHVQNNFPVYHTHRCLSTHDCPYYHLHSDGVLVLNYVTTSGLGWQDRSTAKAYGIALP